MPDVTLFDVAEGVRDSWAAVSALTAIVPVSRLYSFRTAEETARPYTSFGFGDISAYFGGTEYFSGAAYIRKTSVEFKVVVAATDSTRRTLAAAISAAFGWSSTNAAASWVIPNATKVISAMPEVENLKALEERVDGVDLLEYLSKFTLTLQCDRG